MDNSNTEGQAQAAVAYAPAVENFRLLDQIVEEGKLGQTNREKEQSREWVKTFVDQAVSKQLKLDRSVDESIAKQIARVDELISKQLNEFLHHEEFQRLEAAWRSLNYLVSQTETSTTLKLRVLNASKRELKDDLNNAAEFDQSLLFKKVYEEEYNQLGGSPYGLLVGDYEFGRSSEDIGMLQKISGVAAAAHAPFIAAASPKMFGWESFTDITQHRDTAKIFESDLYAKWKSFRESDDSRYVGLTMPHMLLREPYGPDSKTIEAFDFNEEVDGRDHKKYLWGNAAYALASRITNAFAKYEWCAAIRGVEGGGLVEDLPLHTFTTEDGDIAPKCPTEVAIGERRDHELSNLGFIPLCHNKGRDQAVFFGAQSVQKPKRYLDSDANANARLSCQLQYILAVSRFAHYLKVMMRDKIGSFTSRVKLEQDLNKWISYYICLDDSASHETKAQYPLREARIEVREDESKPGAYEAVALLRPHFQLDELNVSLRLVAKVPQLGK